MKNLAYVYDCGLELGIYYFLIIYNNVPIFVKLKKNKLSLSCFSIDYKLTLSETRVVPFGIYTIEQINNYTIFLSCNLIFVKDENDKLFSTNIEIFQNKVD